MASRSYVPYYKLATAQEGLARQPAAGRHIFAADATHPQTGGGSSSHTATVTLQHETIMK